VFFPFSSDLNQSRNVHLSTIDFSQSDQYSSSETIPTSEELSISDMNSFSSEFQISDIVQSFSHEFSPSPLLTKTRTDQANQNEASTILSPARTSSPSSAFVDPNTGQKSESSTNTDPGSPMSEPLSFSQTLPETDTLSVHPSRTLGDSILPSRSHSQESPTSRNRSPTPSLAVVRKIVKVIPTRATVLYVICILILVSTGSVFLVRILVLRRRISVKKRTGTYLRSDIAEPRKENNSTVP
jgi:hypothetical protein